GIHKLRPGHVAILHENKKEPDITAYWCLSDVADAGAKNPFRGSVDEAMEEVERLLLNAVRGQMMADVPLGCFLSGGVDSSLTTALMQSLSDKPIKTFSIGFEEEAYNEAPYARAVATHLGTDHQEMIVTEQQARDVVPKLPQIYSEPFSDSSQIPTYLVSQLARSKVTVSLSGDAGDELFSGYRRYQLGDGLWQKLEMFPEGARHMAAKAFQSVSPDLWNSAVPRFLCRENAGDKIHKVADIIDSPSGNELYRRLVSHWRNPEKLVLGGKEPPTMLTGLDAVPLMPNFVQRMMLLDQQSYLPDDILVKLDRAGMGVALESRVPMLDHRLIEFTWRLPLSVLRHGGKSKAPLRAVLYKHVPCNLIERPKVGFGVPLDRWLRGSLRDWAEDLLSEKRLREDGFFNAAMVRAVWAEHLSGRYNRAYWLWDILMFQAFVGGRGSFPKC
ncbi:MAG: asparagine synthetase B, partial [Bdellovibrionales bacterium]